MTMSQTNISQEQEPHEIISLSFKADDVKRWQDHRGRHRNWPTVYTLNNQQDVYVGESINAAARMTQHLDSDDKKGLKEVRIILDDTFNKSVCLDLESFLIRMFSGDGQYQVTNRNVGVTDAEYYQRNGYQEKFTQIFDELHQEGLFKKKIKDIINSDLFKLSPFKALNGDQEAVIEDILDGLFEDLQQLQTSTSVVQGGPGTGKTIVAIYLLKLLVDIRDSTEFDPSDSDATLGEFFSPGHSELLTGARIGFVIPQQALRDSVKKVFRKTPGLNPKMVMSPFDVVNSNEHFEILVVDETHRLTQYGAQAMGTLTKLFREKSQELALLGEDWKSLTQIDWIKRKSNHQIFLLDSGQSVRPIDVPERALLPLRQNERKYQLSSQMRVTAGDGYLDYMRQLLSDHRPPIPQAFPDYDLRFYDDAEEMYEDIIKMDEKHGLSRLLAGYAWKWNSKGRALDSGVYDIKIGNLKMPWNRVQKDWVSSETSLQEVGSIHTIQGYDLNYAGVIIGNDIYLDPSDNRVKLNRAKYFDTKGKSNNKLMGQTYSDEDVLEMVKNIYHVLLTRGMLGTFVYVCDIPLRKVLQEFFPIR